MATRPRQVCEHPGCPNLTRGRYCGDHADAEPANRARLYGTAEWRRLRADQLAREPWCDCGRKATVADHDTPHRGDPELFFDPNNLVSMCSSCHGRKSASERQTGWDYRRR